MNRREFHAAVAGLIANTTGPSLFANNKIFRPEWPSLEEHQVPKWFQEAKLGIFIHWGLYSVPAWAPPTGELGKVDKDKWFTYNPYAEWYLNSLRIAGSPTHKHHVETYGRDFDYYRFKEAFDKENQTWHPNEWAKLFEQTGARYVVLTTKHHDGFRLWPSDVRNPKAARETITAKRDLVGELTQAVRARNMKMGLYYSGGLDWTFTNEPIRSEQDLYARVPQSVEYAKYADAHWRELIRRYQPAVLWNDISYPKAGEIPNLFAEYYNAVPDGVINNRFGVQFADYTTPEYSKYDKITPKKWEACRGLGFSFGYNRAEGPDQVIAPDKLVALLVDIVSKNGNLLLNVGPRPDGTISDIQLDRLQKLGAWLGVNGEGIFGSRPWQQAAANADDGTDIRFTQKGDALYVFFLTRPGGSKLSIHGVQGEAGTKAEILGASSAVSVTTANGGMVLETKNAFPPDVAITAKITPLPRIRS
jgi:alpha-L-fucosidase